MTMMRVRKPNKKETRMATHFMTDG